MMMILPKLLGNLFYQTHLPFTSQACIPTILGYIYIYENLILWITLRGVPIGISQSHILLDRGRPNTGL
jgi:hypothetical protein